MYTRLFFLLSFGGLECCICIDAPFALQPVSSMRAHLQNRTCFEHIFDDSQDGSHQCEGLFF